MALEVEAGAKAAAEPIRREARKNFIVGICLGCFKMYENENCERLKMLVERRMSLRLTHATPPRALTE